MYISLYIIVYRCMYIIVYMCVYIIVYTCVYIIVYMCLPFSGAPTRGPPAVLCPCVAACSLCPHCCVGSLTQPLDYDSCSAPSHVS